MKTRMVCGALILLVAVSVFAAAPRPANEPDVVTFYQGPAAKAALIEAITVVRRGMEHRDIFFILPEIDDEAIVAAIEAAHNGGVRNIQGAIARASASAHPEIAARLRAACVSPRSLRIVEDSSKIPVTMIGIDGVAWLVSGPLTTATLESPTAKAVTIKQCEFYYYWLQESERAALVGIYDEGVSQKTAHVMAGYNRAPCAMIDLSAVTSQAEAEAAVAAFRATPEFEAKATEMWGPH